MKVEAPPELNHTILEFREALVQKKISALEICEMHLKQIAQVNPSLNALVEDRFEAARNEAEAADRRIQKDPDTLTQFPLLGIPFTVKEMLAFPGMKQTLGSIHRKDFRPQSGSTVVERLREAGAIALGTSNVPELGFWFESENMIYGRTSNPHSIDRTAGGSSGGEAALVAARASVFGVGSDIGGSIRIPAGFCGVFGHKPTYRSLPVTGHFPILKETASEWSGSRYPMTSVGPLARSARDLRILLSIMNGPDDYDPGVTGSLPLTNLELLLNPKFEEGSQAGTWLKGKKVYLLPKPRMWGVFPTDREVSRRISEVGRYLEVLGADVEEMDQDKDLPLLGNALSIWFSKLGSQEGRSFEKMLGGGSPINTLADLSEMIQGRGKYTVPGYLTAVLEKLSKKFDLQNSHSAQRAAGDLQKLFDDVQRLLSPSAVLIMPTHPRVAPRHRHTYVRPFDFIPTAIWNALGFPATNVPVGTVPVVDGKLQLHIPVGIQIIGDVWQDDLNLKMAEVIESRWPIPKL